MLLRFCFLHITQDIKLYVFHIIINQNQLAHVDVIEVVDGSSNKQPFTLENAVCSQCEMRSQFGFICYALMMDVDMSVS